MLIYFTLRETAIQFHDSISDFAIHSEVQSASASLLVSPEDLKASKCENSDILKTNNLRLVILNGK